MIFYKITFSLYRYFENILPCIILFLLEDCLFIMVHVSGPFYSKTQDYNFFCFLLLILLATDLANSIQLVYGYERNSINFYCPPRHYFQRRSRRKKLVSRGTTKMLSYNNCFIIPVTITSVFFTLPIGY
jgi:hypothetical protein